MVSCSSSAILPTATITVTDRVTSTVTWTPAATLSATLSMSETPSATPDPASQIVFSPDGKFVAKRYDPYGRPSLENDVIEVFDQQNKLLWQIPYQGERLTGDPGTSLTIYGWANDSSQLYFYYSHFPDGGDFAFWWDGADLQSIEIQTGQLRRVLPGEGSMAFAISPDGTQIAYTREQDTPGILFLRNLANNQDMRIMVEPEQKYTRVGDIHWSPSGKALIFHTEAEPQENWVQVQVIHLDAVAMKQKLVKQYDLESMWFEGWVGEHTLRFRGRRGEPIFLIDVITNETTIIGTATPSP
jgi:Tol biopolymer transport system component